MRQRARRARAASHMRPARLPPPPCHAPCTLRSACTVCSTRRACDCKGPRSGREALNACRRIQRRLAGRHMDCMPGAAPPPPPGVLGPANRLDFSLGAVQGVALADVLAATSLVGLGEGGAAQQRQAQQRQKRDVLQHCAQGGAEGEGTRTDVSRVQRGGLGCTDPAVEPPPSSPLPGRGPSCLAAGGSHRGVTPLGRDACTLLDVLGRDAGAHAPSKPYRRAGGEGGWHARWGFLAGCGTSLEAVATGGDECRVPQLAPRSTTS